ncbi:hypothetical protein LXL04_007279 [Taraxacum kok-saghyz]
MRFPARDPATSDQLRRVLAPASSTHATLLRRTPSSPASSDANPSFFRRTPSSVLCSLEALKLKIKACKSKEEGESLKFNEKHIINKIYTESVEAKVPAVLDYLGTVLEGPSKLQCDRAIPLRDK